MNIINLSVPAGVSSPVAECGAVMIGYVGESGVTQVVLDFSAWAEVYGDGVITLGVQRSRDASWYPVALSVDGTTAAWLVSRTDTNVEGMGVARFAYAVGGAEKRSAVWQFFVDRGLQSPEGDAPDPYESWVETLTELGEETLENAQDAQEAAEDAEQSATDAAGSAESAETAKNAAGAAAAAAGESARAAGESASTAQGAAQTAQSAAGEAEQSATDAEAAQQAAETAVTHYPKIVNDYWWVWDVTTGAYVNTNVKAKGEDGEGAVLSVNGKTGAVTLDAEDVGALPEGTTLDDIPDGSTYKRATAAQVQQISTNTADIQTQGGEIDQLQTDVDAIEQKIPNQASSSNQLADKDFVNSSINSAAAYFRGAFPTRAALFAVPWQTADPGAENYVSNNDYAYVADDEAHNDEAWRYIYVLQPGGADNGWQPQFRVNESPLTAAQLAALNSGATAALIEQISTNAAAIALKQAVINASGLLKGNGNGQVSAAVAGTDYQTPLTAGTDYATPAQVNAKYTKPAGGIPASDMAQAVQTSLGKADTALQAVPNTYRTAAAQDVIDAGKLPATTKYAGSQSVGGAADKTVSIPTGSVDLTSTATDFKASVDGITELRSGVLVWLTNGVVTSAAGCTLNINNLGAKPIYISIAATTATTTTFNVNYTMLFIYNANRVEGGCWDMVYGYDSNTTYTPAKLGFGYATCSTAAATTAKVASLSSYSLVAGGLVAVNFSNDVPAGATLNINSKGAKAIYYKGTAIEAGVINAGDTALFVYSTYYRLLSIDRWGTDIGKADEEIADLKSAFGLTDIGVKSASITQPDLTLVQGNRISALNGQSGSSFYCSIESTPVKVSSMGACPFLFTAKAGKKYTLTVRHISGSHNGSNPLDVQVFLTDGTNYIAQIPASGGSAVYSPSVDTAISVCIYVKYSVITTNLIFDELLIEDGHVTADVQIAGTSIVQNGVANIPMASASTPGVVISGAVTVTGTTPTITAQPGVRYVCGEVATLDITLPASGVVDVTFESGSTATVLTVTPPSGVTLKWANGFDPDNLDADTTYEINIMDGLGVAAQWT